MSIDSTDGCDSNAVSIVKIGPAVFIPWPFEKSKSLLLANSYRICQYVGRSGLSVCLLLANSYRICQYVGRSGLCVCYWRILTEFASMLVGPVCVSVCLSVCLSADKFETL